MKTTLTILTLLALTLITHEASAQAGSTRIGIGASFNAINITASSVNDEYPIISLYLPLQLGSSYRLEPEAGLSNGKLESQTQNDLPPQQTTNIKSTFTVFKAGLGSFFTFQPVRSTNAYIGARLGFNYLHTEYKVDQKISRSRTTSLFASPALGGEYFLSDYLSLGVELQLVYTYYFTPKDESTEQEPSQIIDYSRYSLITSTLIFARFYF